jgi:hypothetical protein
MAVTKGDIKFVKSATVTDTSTNGGRKGYTEVTNRQKYNLFPRVSRPERINGITRYRKQFVWNKNVDNETAFGMKLYPLIPTPGGDRMYVALGTQSDRQSDIDSTYKWHGCGPLNANISAGAQQLAIAFEANDAHVDNNKTIILNSHILTGQTIASTVKPYDAVKWDSGQSKWIKEAAPDEDSEDVYPYGTFMGNGKVFSYNVNGCLEYLTSQNNQYTAQILATGNGSQTVFSGLTITHYPVKVSTTSIRYTIGSVQYTATDNGSGAITGTNLSSGTVNYDTGIVALTFQTAPDNSTNITVDYTQRSWSWSGNVCTINVQEQIANAYSTSNTYCSVGIEAGDIMSSLTDKTVVSASGTFDEIKPTLYNLGTVEDTWTITFTSSTAFTCSGTVEGSVGTGSINAQFAPTNSNVGQPFFTIPTNAWGGTWAANDTAQFKSHPAAAALWVREVVPANTSQYSDNGMLLEVYVE